MQPFTRLGEDRRSDRRTVADAFDVVRQHFRLDQIERARIEIGGLQLPSGALTLARAVDDPALRRKSWSRRVVRLGRDYSVSLAQLRARPRRQCDGISAGAR